MKPSKEQIEAAREDIKNWQNMFNNDTFATILTCLTPPENVGDLPVLVSDYEPRIGEGGGDGDNGRN
ncbi:MAG: hypothetical protein KGJ95_10455 [Candidatus Omnitrophica bacterium]|nr:hypothetical protein [Candidatus Omnitrophota bacterium]